MTLTITLSYWMIPLAALWAFGFYSLWKPLTWGYPTEYIFLAVTAIALLTRFLP